MVMKIKTRHYIVSVLADTKEYLGNNSKFQFTPEDGVPFTKEEAEAMAVKMQARLPECIVKAELYELETNIEGLCRRLVKYYDESVMAWTATPFDEEVENKTIPRLEGYVWRTQDFTEAVNFYADPSEEPITIKDWADRVADRVAHKALRNKFNSFTFKIEH